MARELLPAELRRTCPPEVFTFRTTDELEPLAGIIGQDRAVEALRVGLALRQPAHRYNVFVTGEPGLGKTSAVAHFLREISSTLPTPPDICYVHNFQVPHAPRYLLVPPGRGRELRLDMERCVEFLARELPKILESEEFKARAKREREKFGQRREEVFRQLEQRAAALGFAIQRTPVGVNTIPLKPDGTPFSQDEYQALSPEEQAGILHRQEELQESVRETFQKLGELEESWQEIQRDITKRAVQFMIAPRFAQLRAKYAGLDRVQTFLKEVENDVVENAHQLQGGEKKPPLPLPFPFPEAPDRFARYRVNVIVDRTGQQGAPVVVEENATYTNLFGTMERKVQFGVVTTDFTQIRAGSLHRANGGFLVLSASNLLRFGLSWEALKIALKGGEIRIEDPAQMLGLASTEGLRPEPVPLDVKVIIIGSPYLYYLLHYYDDDFRKLFAIRADFDREMPWTEDTVQALARFIRARRDINPSLLPYSPDGVARVVEWAAEMAGDQKKLTTHFGQLASLVDEASFWAREEWASLVTAQHVRKAIRKGRRRHALLAERIREWIARGKIVVNVHGTAVGQVNGLAVIDLGDFAFGKPTRITANVFTGKSGVVDIEREAELGGKLHTKGVLILKGYVGERFGGRQPVSFSASLALEQTYTGVEGDSASAAELYALLSALSGVPFKQGVAVTGAIDQKGRLQPIGGVNEKVEGHFLVCQELGLTGDQGVIIPSGNVDDLMLPEEVVEAVAAGKFHLWACDHVEQGLSVLTDVPIGERDSEGHYPPESLFGRVERRLEEIRSVLEKDEG